MWGEPATAGAHYQSSGQEETAGRDRTSFSRVIIGPAAGYVSTPNYGKGMQYGGLVGFNFSRTFGVDFRVGMYEGDVAGEAGGLSKGTLKTVSAHLGLKVRLPINRTLSPFITAGGSYFKNSFSLDPGIVSDWASLGFEVTESLDNAFGFFAGGGLDIRLTSRIQLSLDVRYCPASTKGTWSFVDTGSGTTAGDDLNDLKLNPFLSSFGIVFGF